MYGFSEDTDWSRLVGKTISHVVFGTAQVVLDFEDDGSIDIEGSFELKRGDAATRATAQEIFGCAVLVSLVMDTITGANRRDGDHLALSFRSGAVLELIDEGGFESFHFHGEWCGEIHV